MIAEAAPLMKKDILSKWFTECKEYVISTCCKCMDTETLEDLCQVYETMEAVVIHPHENILTKAGDILDEEVTVERDVASHQRNNTTSEQDTDAELLMNYVIAREMELAESRHEYSEA